jgi:hypothetical protein
MKQRLNFRKELERRNTLPKKQRIIHQIRLNYILPITSDNNSWYTLNTIDIYDVIECDDESVTIKGFNDELYKAYNGDFEIIS